MKKPAAPSLHVLRRWLMTNSSSVGKHQHHLMAEQPGVRATVLNDLRPVVRTPYTSPEIAAQRVAELGSPATAKILRELLPKTTTRSTAPSEAFTWSCKATDEAVTKRALEIRCHPRVTHHGGATKTAVGG